MISAAHYKADSVRSENGGNGVTYGKFRGHVESSQVVTQKSAEGWSYLIAGRWTGGDYDTESEALEQGVASLIAKGWSTELAAVEAEANALAKARHDKHCHESAAYRKHYGALIV